MFSSVSKKLPFIGASVKKIGHKGGTLQPPGNMQVTRIPRKHPPIDKGSKLRDGCSSPKKAAARGAVQCGLCSGSAKNKGVDKDFPW